MGFYPQTRGPIILRNNIAGGKYPQTRGPQVITLVEIPQAYPVHRGPSLVLTKSTVVEQTNIGRGRGPSLIKTRVFDESYPVHRNVIAIDSTDTAVPRISNWIQRPLVNVGDLIGTIFNSTGNPISLNSIEYSKVGISGPWLAPAGILTGDGAWNLPNGTPAGQAFNLVLLILDSFTGSIWFKLVIDITTGGGPATVDDVEGPFFFEFFAPEPLILTELDAPATTDAEGVGPVGDTLADVVVGDKPALWMSGLYGEPTP